MSLPQNLRLDIILAYFSSIRGTVKFKSLVLKEWLKEEVSVSHFGAHGNCGCPAEQLKEAEIIVTPPNA